MSTACAAITALFAVQRYCLAACAVVVAAAVACHLLTTPAVCSKACSCYASLASTAQLHLVFPAARLPLQDDGPHGLAGEQRTYRAWHAACASTGWTAASGTGRRPNDKPHARCTATPASLVATTAAAAPPRLGQLMRCWDLRVAATAGGYPAVCILPWHVQQQHSHSTCGK